MIPILKMRKLSRDWLTCLWFCSRMWEGSLARACAVNQDVTVEAEGVGGEGSPEREERGKEAGILENTHIHCPLGRK